MKASLADDAAAVDDAPSRSRSAISPLWKRLAQFTLLLAVLWLGFYAAARSLPYVEPGHQLIYALAQDTIRSGVVFPEDVRAVRVAVFGDSQVQAGFRPDLFDALSDRAAYSFNIGLPDDSRFLDGLRTLVERGQAPDIVALTDPWSTEAEPNPWTSLDDGFLLEKLFPFRNFPRDATLFLLRSLSRGGPKRYYAAAQENVAKTRRARGYFFIEGMSHFPNHRLPEDFRLDGDDPTRGTTRKAQPSGPLFAELLELQARADFTTVFVPYYVRVGALAPAPPNDALRTLLAPHGIGVLGPNYWRYPNALFSDPVHLNPEGADVYTTDLWALMEPTIRETAARKLAARD